MEEKLSIDWQTDLERGLAKAKATGTPVLIDTWATWCANCKVLEKTTFSDSRIIDESKQFVALKLQLEKADSPETKAFMKRFGLKHYSLPTTLLLAPSGKVIRLFQGVIGPDELLAEMRKVRSSATN